MSIEMHPDGDLLEVTVTGKLKKADYDVFVPQVERLIEQHGKLRTLFVMRDFHGWSAGALWQDVAFDLKHFNDVSRLAMVGDRAWEKGMAVFCKPFTTAKVKYFTLDELDRARAWVRGDA